MSTPIETIPVMELAPRDLEHLVEELRAYRTIYNPVSSAANSASRHKYLHGLLLELPRKSIEPMVLAGREGLA